MKPLNLSDPTCNPISSNCVIWQGPDIECIGLCKGDSVSEVVYKLATELCSILNILDIDYVDPSDGKYDWSCLNLNCCEPKNFRQLIQTIIDKLCELNNCCEANPGNNTPSGCPDCEIPINPAFYYTNPQGDVQKKMQLTDYATAMGNKIGTLITQITILQQTVVQLNQRITILENAPVPTFTLPKVTPYCVLPAVPTEMNMVLAALENQFCLLRSALGSHTDIYNNIAKQCLGISSSTALATNSTMAGIPGWNNTVGTAAESIGNLWIALCDIRAAVKTIQINCCPTGCDGIVINLYAEVVGTSLKLYFTGTLPANFTNCGSGTLFTITDSNGGTMNYTVDIAGNINNPTGFSIQLSGTPVDPNLSISITGDPCFTNTETGSVCKSYLEYKIDAEACCPEITLTPSVYTVNYKFNTCSGDHTYTVELWNEAVTTMLQSVVYTTSGAQTINGNFAGLTGSTVYKLRIKDTSSSADSYCPFVSFTTSPDPCTPPSNVIAQIIS